MNSKNLKIFAMVTMMIDHVGVTLNALYKYQVAGKEMMFFMADAYWQLRIIGRLAFPIFAFLIAEGCAHTRDIKAYLKRLYLFAIISQLPYQAVVNLSSGGHNIWEYLRGNVFVTLALGASAVYCYQMMLQNKEKSQLYRFGIFACFIAVVVFKGEYDFGGLFIILFVYIFRPKKDSDLDAFIRGSKHLQVLVCALVTGLYYHLLVPSFTLQTIAAVSSAVPLLFYNGKSGNRKGKMAFYVLYPLHLTILAVIMLVVMK